MHQPAPPNAASSSANVVPAKTSILVRNVEPGRWKSLQFNVPSSVGQHFFKPLPSRTPLAPTTTPLATPRTMNLFKKAVPIVNVIKKAAGKKEIPEDSEGEVEDEEEVETEPEDNRPKGVIIIDGEEFAWPEGRKNCWELLMKYHSQDFGVVEEIEEGLVKAALTKPPQQLANEDAQIWRGQILQQCFFIEYNLHPTTEVIEKLPILKRDDTRKVCYLLHPESTQMVGGNPVAPNGLVKGNYAGRAFANKKFWEGWRSRVRAYDAERRVNPFFTIGSALFTYIGATLQQRQLRILRQIEAKKIDVNNIKVPRLLITFSLGSPVVPRSAKYSRKKKAIPTVEEVVAFDARLLLDGTHMVDQSRTTLDRVETICGEMVDAFGPLQMLYHVYVKERATSGKEVVEVRSCDASGPAG
ncbi:hypothetical protein P7C70_g1123, partial [Phenoliferia sp. Uapishka_3]